MYHTFTTLFLIGAFTTLVLTERSLETLDKRATPVDFYNPLASGGKFFAFDELTGLGDPLNVTTASDEHS